MISVIGIWICVFLPSLDMVSSKYCLVAGHLDSTLNWLSGCVTSCTSHLVVTLLPRIVTLLLPTWMSNSLLQGISSPISSHGSQEPDPQDGMLKSWSKLLFVSLLSHVLMNNSGIGAQDVERWCFVWRHIFGNWHHRVRAGALWLLLVWTTGAQDVADRWCSFTFHLVTLTDTQCSLNVVIPSGHNTHAHKKKATLETHQKYYFSQLLENFVL